nr:uncharacterized protein LOC111510056 [Leptinotarsa decemlineata]
MESKTNIPKKRKPRTLSKRKKLMSYFREYCDYTGIHGFRYIGEDRTIYEKIWWITSLVVSIIFCSLMIHEIFQKYIHYPVLVTFSMQETRLQKIPFPAVTICPRAKISQSYLNSTELRGRQFENLPITIEEEKQLNLASTICEFYATPETDNTTKDEDFYDFLEKSRTNFFQYCQYLGKEVDCENIFTPILTEEGICYSYNILDRDDIFRESFKSKFPDFHKTQPIKNWNVEGGYFGKDFETYPKRALRIGVKNSLMVVLKTEVTDIEYECAYDESGFRVTLHSPFTIPNVPENFFNLPLNGRVIGNIIPHMIKTSDGVKMFDASKRDCYFQSDKTLKYFKIYSQENCMLECKMNYTLQFCGCVEFYMPQIHGVPVCLLQKIECLEKVDWMFTMSSAYSEVTESLDDNMNCVCRPTCTEITYGMSLSYNTLKLVPVNRTLREYLDEEHYQYSSLSLYFKSNHIETKERSELYGFSDVISNFGGLLGLFTGFSILSFIEIIYFLSLRLWSNFQLYGNWSGQRNYDGHVLTQVAIVFVMGSLDNAFISTGDDSVVDKRNRRADFEKFSTNLNSYCWEYYDNTGIHGFKYFGERRSLFEKILWIIIFITSMILCIAVIYQTYRKWQTSPVIVNFDSGETNIYEIPFPAVTICNEVKSTRRYFNFSDVMKKHIVDEKKLDSLELKNLQYMSMLCGEGKRFSKYIPNISTIDEDFYRFLGNASVGFLKNCSWMSENHDCLKIFRPIVTDEGLCMTFNMLDDRLVYRNVVHLPAVNKNLNHAFPHWTVDYGYSENAGINTYPRRALLAGSSNALIVNMEVEKADLDYACTSFQGYQVVLHKAIRFPTVQQHYFRVPLGKSVIVAISASQLLTSEDVKYYSSTKRECYLQGEKDLKFFQNYTQFNCKLECLANHTLHLCGCVAFYMPRERGIPICGNGNKQCMKDVKNYLDMSGLRHSIDGESTIRNFGVLHCDCLPMCTLVEYNTEITEIDFDLYKEIESIGINTDKDERLASSQLVIYFKSNRFIPYMRNELYGHLDFLANIGGLLGLFVGFSIVSLIEIIYFLSVRIICNMKLYKHWYGEDLEDTK